MDESRTSGDHKVLRKAPIELAAVIRGALEHVRPLIEAAGHEFVVTLPAQPVYLDANLERLTEAFSTLLHNAAMYAEGGEKIWLSSEREGGAVVVSIRDGRLGIPSRVQHKLSDIFRQVDRSLERSQGVLGTGLNLVRESVELHGGRVEARSAGPGRGSEFIVHLPVLVGWRPGESQATGAGGSRGIPSKRRILVVDDNKDSADILGAMLRLMGNEVRIAHDGVEAVDEAARFRPDVVLLDISLPKLSGYDAARQIRERPGGKEIFLIATTGWAQDDDKRRVAEAGFDSHIVKPVDLPVLENLLSGLRRSPARG